LVLGPWTVARVIVVNVVDMVFTMKMFFVITVMLTFNNADIRVEREYKQKSFQDTWSCHEFIAGNKMVLLLPHIQAYGDNLRGFEFYCESRYAEEV
tara:strand:+ start:10 stop:297 length:288 start_codon:yes stop_codon:yes gene_type:complete